MPLIPVPRIGFELNENETSVTVMEGGTREVCVGLLWPKKMEVILYIHVTLTPDSPRGELLVQGGFKFYLLGRSNLSLLIS